MNLEIINLTDNSRQHVPVTIPKKFYTFSNYDKTTRYYSLYTSYMGIDYRGTPSGIRYVSLDLNPTFTYVYHITENHIETLITILDIETLETSQYVFESKEGIEPYFIAHDRVYCLNTMSEDMEIIILPTNQVLATPVQYSKD